MKTNGMSQLLDFIQNYGQWNKHTYYKWFKKSKLLL